MSYNKVKPTPTNQRGGRGSYGRGNHQNRNYVQHANHLKEEWINEHVDYGNQGTEKGWKQTNYGDRRQVKRGKDGPKNYNNPERGHFKRPLAPSRGSFSRNGNSHTEFVPTMDLFGADSSRLPKHAQNPIFVKELQQRFISSANSLMPSFALWGAEIPNNKEQTGVTLNQGLLENNAHSFASISNNIGYGFRNSSNETVNPTNSDTRHDFGSWGNKPHSKRDSEKSFTNSNLSNHSGFPAANYGQFQSTHHVNERPLFTPGDMENVNNSQRSNALLSAGNFLYDSSRPPPNMHTVDDKTSRLGSSPAFNSRRQPPPLHYMNDNRRLPQTMMNYSDNGEKLQRDYTSNKKTGSELKKFNNRNRRFEDSRVARSTTSSSSSENSDKAKRENRKNPQPIFPSRVNSQQHISSADNDNLTSQSKMSQNGTSKKTGVKNRKTRDPIDSERISKILIAHGFKGKHGEENTSKPSEVNSSKPQLQGSSLIASLLSQMEAFGSLKKIESVSSEHRNSENGEKGNLSLYQEPKNLQTGKTNPSPNLNRSNISTYNYSELTDGEIAGGVSFNIQRSANDGGLCTQTQSEAFRKLEEEYKNSLAKHQEKEKDKEAKKREQYLAKYQHIDQGHRLAEPYLDEATGYAPAWEQYLPSEEEARQMQQDKLDRDALVFQEQEEKAMEQRKWKDEEKMRERLMKSKNIDAGYKLGHKDNQGLPRNDGPQQRAGSLKNSGPQGTTANDSKASQVITPDFAITPDMMLEGESVEDAHDRIQEQLLIESILYEEEQLGQSSKKQVLTSLSKDVMPHHLANFKETTNQQQKVVQPQQLHCSNNRDLNPGKMEARSEVMKSVETRASLKPTQTNVMDNDRDNSLKEKLMLKLDSILAKPGNPRVEQGDSFQTITQPEAPKPLTLASCVVKNPNQGPVLVLRPSEAALNLALTQKLEVQDEMDKQGSSAVYKPNVEQALYSNNRFERNSLNNIAKATGAIPKQKFLTPDKTSSNFSLKTAGEPEVNAVDFQAEMRAARLRMQQKYEETLKNRLENP